MINVQPKYITDDTGKKISVILSIKEFRSIIEELEDLEDVRLFDAAMASNETSLPIDDAFKLIEKKRKKKKK